MAKQTAPMKTDFDDETEDMKSVLPAVTPTAKDVDGVPYCVKHHCRMKTASSGPAGSAVAYCKCPVDGCAETGKRIKTDEKRIPGEPLRCHRCVGVDPQPIMERDPAVSSLMQSVLKCPVCGHRSGPMPRPEFVLQHERSRNRVPVADIGAR